MTTKTDDFGFVPLEQGAPAAPAQAPSKDDFGFQAAPEQDSKLKSLFRTVYQPVSGRLNITPYGIITGLWDILGTGDSLNTLDEDFSPERIAELRKQFPNAPWENFDKQYPTHEAFREKYLEGLETARNTIPTIGNIEKGVESLTGAPLEAQTDTQRILKTLGTGYRLTPGSASSKAQGAVLATGGQALLEAAGVPAGIAEPISLILGGGTPKLGSVVKEVKPSGLPARRFEDLTKERTVTPSQADSVRKAVETDVRKATSKLIEENSMTARALKEDAGFPQKIDHLLGEVEELAAQLPDDGLNTYDVLEKVKARQKARQSTGITTSEADRAYLRETNRLQKELRKGKQITNSQQLKQYRKTNKELGEYFEPGKSKGANAGKRDALIDYNRALADVWQERYPDSEFNKLFKFTNKRYSELADLENIDKFMDKVFTDKKVDFNQGKRFFKDEKLKRSFERTLGEEGYKEIEGVFNDFISTEKSMKLIKEAESAGFRDVLKYAKRWVFSPGGIWAKGTAIKDASTYVRNELLSNQKFRVTWKSAIEDFKKGDFAKATAEFKELEALEKEATNSHQ